MGKTKLGTCIFCKSDTTTKTKPEHVLLNAFGGRKITRRVICSDCNENFGGTIDRTAAAQVAEIRNLLGLKSGDLKLPPEIKGLEAGGQKLSLDKKGRPRLVQKPFTVSRDEVAREIALKVQAPNIEQFETNLFHGLRAAGIPEDKMHSALSTRSAKMYLTPPPAIRFSLQFGGEEILRSVTKSCLVLWALEVGNDELLSDRYSETRNYVVNGGKYYPPKRIFIDAERLPFEAQITDEFGPVFNSIVIKSDAAGRVIAHFTLYNLIGWSIVLAESGSIPNKLAVLLSSSLDPKRWTDSLPRCVDIPENWPKLGELEEVEEYYSRLSSVLALSQELGRKRAFEEIIVDTFKEFGLEEDEVISNELALKISSTIASRLASMLCRVPYVSEFDIGDIIDRLNNRSVRKDH